MKNQKKTNSRLLSVTLALLIAFGTVIPLSPVARADDTETTVGTWSELVAAVDDPDVETIIISNDITLEGSLKIDRDLTFKAGDVSVTLTAKSGERHITIGEYEDPVEEDITLTFDGVVLDGGYSDGEVTSGGIEAYMVDEDNLFTLTLVGAVIQNCNKQVAPGDVINFGGGGVYVLGSLVMEDCKITGNSTIKENTDSYESLGNGVFAYGDLTVSGGEISGNYFAGNEEYIINNYGGGLAAFGTIEIKDGAKITGNTAGFGGGIFTLDSVYIYSGTLIGGKDQPNTAEFFGGGVYCGYYLTMYGGEISYNTAGNDGGGVYADKVYMGTTPIASSINVLANALTGITDGIIKDNNAGNDGGGVWCESLILTSGYINENIAGNNGGGAYVNIDVYSSNGNEVNVGNEGYIQYNEAGQHGGGLYVVKGPEPIPSSFSVIVPNSISIPYYPNVLIEGGTIDHNEAVSGDGGGVFTNVSVKMTDGVINYNRAPNGNGGGMYVYNGYYTDGMVATIRRDVIYQILSGQISYNQARNGGGVYLTKPIIMEYPEILTYTIGMIAGEESPADTSLKVYITNNTAVKNGGGIYTEDFEDYGELTEDDYQNIETYNNVFFSGNKALAAYVPPVIAADYANILWGSISLTTHPINNYDINYEGENKLTFTVYYHAGGGRGSYSDPDLTYDESYTVLGLSRTGITRTGYTFKGWNTRADGRGTSYSAGDVINITGDVDLYAQWKEVTTDGKSSDDGSGDDSIRRYYTGDNSTAKSILDTENHFAYVIGYDDGNVRPEDTITRAEVATIFFRLLTDDYRADVFTQINNYSDVDSDKWYNNAISTLSNADLLTGYTDGSFGPNDKITRAELAVIAARFAIASGTTAVKYDTSFYDISGHWAEDDIRLAANLGYVKGYSDGSYKPNEYITRAEVMTLLNRVLNRHVEAEEDMLDDMKRWADNTNDKWYYYDVQEATNSHYYARKYDGINEVWTALRTSPDWKMLEGSDAVWRAMVN